MSTAVYQVITDRIVRMLDEGVVPWQRPWKASTDLPRSIRNRPYRGINVWLLLFRGYADPRWLTYKQAVELGGKVKRGEKGTPIVLWKPIQVDDPESETGKRTVPLLRYYTVFNVEQCEELNISALPVEEVSIASPIEAAEAIAAGYPAPRPTITFDGGDRAYYDVRADHIHLPDPGQFIHVVDEDGTEIAPGYYSTQFHEMGHSTGHKDRLARPGVVDFDHFGSGQYATEELAAEMTAAFLCGEAGIDPNTLRNSVAYIQNWRQKLVDDPKAVVHAAAQAQKAADFILGRQKEV